MRILRFVAALLLTAALLLGTAAQAGGAVNPETAAETLTLTGGEGADLAFLSGFGNLHSLTLIDCPAADLTPLADCAKLRSLTIVRQTGQPVQSAYDLAPLKRCARLNTLSLSGACVASLAALADLPSLSSLAVQGIGIADYTPVAKLNLSFLSLFGADGSQIDVIFSAIGKKLTSAVLGDCALTEAASSAVLTCTRAVSLRFDNVTGLQTAARAWAKLSSLTTLSMHGCALDSLDFLSNFVSTVVIRLDDVTVGGTVCDLAFDKYFLQADGVPSARLLDFLNTDGSQWLYATIQNAGDGLSREAVAALAGVPTLLSLDARPMAADALREDVWSGFPKLEQLKFSAPGGASLAFLAPLQRLERLAVYDTEITQCETLGSLPALGQLTLIGCTADSWAFLSRVPLLTQLTAAGCNGPDAVSFTAKMPQLSTLVLEDAPIQSLDGLTGRRLTFVSLYGCPVADYAALASLRSLATLSCNDGAVLPELSCRVVHRRYIKQ